MRELRLIGVHDDGEHLLLAETGDGGEKFRLPIDDALRTVVRRERPRPSADIGAVPVPDELRPRDVQALLRAGVSVQDVAERAGWTTEKVLRYEGPIRAEREHIAGLARELAVSGGGTGRADTTFGRRAERRLDSRGVATDDIVWDSWRSQDAEWTVLCSFPAGGRQRQASWHFDVRGRTLEPVDDEARWLGEDESSPGPLSSGSARDASVYDVEAEGGLDAKPKTPVRRVRGGRTSATSMPTHPAGSSSSTDEPTERPVDLVAAMRERSKNRKRKGRSSTTHDFPEDAAPPEQIDTDGDAPPAGSHPHPDDAPATPSVEELGHDPVTGTADLFADLEADAPKTKTPKTKAPQADRSKTKTPKTKTAQVKAAKAEEDAAGSKTAGTDAAGSPETQSPETQSPEAETPADVAEPQDTDAAEADEDQTSQTAPEHEKPQPAAGKPDSGTAVPDRPASARKGRPSVPSWDDIMFGRRPGRS